MGTSSSYKGISGNAILLPMGLDENIMADLIGINNKEAYTQEDTNKALNIWKANIASVKKLFTNSYIDRNSSSIKKALRSYKNIYGGHSGYVKHLLSYRESIYNLSFALSRLSIEGISGVKYLNIDTNGKSASEILLLISEVLSPSGNTKKNTIIREALIQTLSEIDEVEILNDTSSINQNKLNDIMKQYLGNLILSDLYTFMGTNLDKLLPSERKEYEEELKRCIDVQVYSQFRYFDFNMDKSIDEVKDILDEIIRQISELFDGGDSND